MQKIKARNFNFGPCVGRGGFGVVYRGSMCNASGIETEVAIKILRADITPDSQALERLRDEGRLLARINHPNIVFVHDLVTLDGRCALITEYIDGQDFGSIIENHAPFPLKLSVDIIGRVASALEAAWSTPGEVGPLRLIHRDIKPSNIRIGRHGQVKLLDFGIAFAETRDREAHTKSNLIIGSPPYMAPERYLDKESGPRSDIYSLGCTLYEAMRGQKLFYEKSVLVMSTLALDPARFNAHISDQLLVLPDCPKKMGSLLHRMLAYKPELRPTAEEVALTADEIVDEMSGESLKQWCRANNYKRGGSDETRTAPLQGRTVTESSTEADTFEVIIPVDKTKPESRSGATPLLVGGFVFIGTLAAAVILTTSGWLYWNSLEPPQLPQEATVKQPLLNNHKAQTVEETALPIREPMTTSTKPTIAPRKRKQEAESAPTLEQEMAVAVPTTPLVTVELTGDITNVLLQSTDANHTTYTLPSEVPSGNYKIIGTFDGKQSPAGSATATEGVTLTIECFTIQRICKGLIR